MAMLIYLLLETRLKIRDLLGWFNKDVTKRLEYSKHLLPDYAKVPILFPKTHQAYLAQWKRACRSWIGVEGATFEMLKRIPKEESDEGRDDSMSCEEPISKEESREGKANTLPVEEDQSILNEFDGDDTMSLVEDDSAMTVSSVYSGERVQKE